MLGVIVCGYVELVLEIFQDRSLAARPGQGPSFPYLFLSFLSCAGQVGHPETLALGARAAPAAAPSQEQGLERVAEARSQVQVGLMAMFGVALRP